LPVVPTVSVDGLKMYYEIVGAGQPLVLINGLGVDVSECGQLIDALAGRYRVLAFDNRGAGRTDKPDEPYTVTQMARDTAGLMRALGIERSHVVGMSLGGRIALDLALAEPGRVRSLVLASTCARVERRWPIRLLGLVSAVFRGRYPQPRYAFRRQRQASDGYDRTARLPELRVPTLVIHGRRDHIVPYRLAEDLAAGIPGARLVTVDSGHIYPLTHSAAFAEQVAEFTTAI
jgi:pimeloyl-ACP methyl ester carboxylesterase